MGLKANKQVGNEGGTSQGRGGSGEAPARGFRAFTEKEMDPHQHCQRKLSAKFSKRALLLRPQLEIS